MGGWADWADWRSADRASREISPFPTDSPNTDPYHALPSCHVDLSHRSVGQGRSNARRREKIVKKSFEMSNLTVARLVSASDAKGKRREIEATHTSRMKRWRSYATSSISKLLYHV